MHGRRICAVIKLDAGLRGHDKRGWMVGGGVGEAVHSIVCRVCLGYR